MVADADRDLLDERWRWELMRSFRVAPSNPYQLLHLAQSADAEVVATDSIKDVVDRVATDEGGQAFNDAVQTCVANDVDVLSAHHSRKAPSEGHTKLSLDDVYGSTWLTAGAGSVIALDGIVETVEDAC
jgi:replicative DNA helicase